MWRGKRTGDRAQGVGRSAEIPRKAGGRSPGFWGWHKGSALTFFLLKAAFQPEPRALCRLGAQRLPMGPP